jgi:glycosyltransferase involved in cell wall biosynthesis
MISIVTGTLNRVNLIDNLIDNTVVKNEKLELILVDGGSNDGTIEKIKSINHPRVKLIEVGRRSTYPHFMNLGIQNSSYDWICQWNDDVIMINNWDDVILEINRDYDFYLFNWKYGNLNDITNKEWLDGEIYTSGWCLVDETKNNGEIVMNYGLYNKKIFKEIGMYNNSYQYYYADGDMARRAHEFGFKHKSLRNIKVCSLFTAKTAEHTIHDTTIYNDNITMYKNGILPKNLEYLK